MKKWLLVCCAVAGLVVGNTGAKATTTGPVALDATQVTTAGTPVVAVVAGTAYNGCYIQNTGSTNMVIDPVNVANYSTPSSTASILVPGGIWNCPYGTQKAVTVNSGDNAHSFSGIKY